jgi:hypothetical protein
MIIYFSCIKEYIIKNNLAVFFIGIFVSTADAIFSEQRFVFTIIGGVLILFSFYLMSLSKK